MADITNPQAVKFCTESVRPLTDALITFYYLARKVKDRYISIGGSTLIPNDASVIVDGAATTGKPIITGEEVNAALAIMNAIVVDLEANNSAKLQQLLAVGPGDNNAVR